MWRKTTKGPFHQTGWVRGGADTAGESGRTLVITCLHWAQKFWLTKMPLMDTFPLPLWLSPFLTSPLIYSFLFPRSEIFSEASVLTPDDRMDEPFGLFLHVVHILWSGFATCFVHKFIIMSHVIFIKLQPSGCYMVFHFHRKHFVPSLIHTA